MADRITKTSSKGYFSRIGGAIQGVFIGLLMVVVAFPLLFWNEGRAVKTAKSLDEGAAAVVTVNAAEVDPANDQALIHFIGDTEVEGSISDPQFPVTVEAIALKREVEMYQWYEDSNSETKEKLGGGTETVTTYDYGKRWDSNVINSGSFEQTAGHENPGSMPYSGEETFSQNVSVGAFSLSDTLIRKIRNFQSYTIGEEFYQELPASLQNQSQMQGTQLYIGQNPGSPQIGDTRVSFSMVPAGTVSVISQQNGTNLTPYQTDAGRALEYLSVGSKSAEVMFEEQKQANVVMTWLIRLGGFLLMFMGFGLMMGPLSVVASVIPFVGRVVGFGTNLVAGALSMSFSLITIAIAWIFFRPLLGILLLVVAGGIITAIVVLVMKTKAAKSEEVEAGLDGDVGV